MKIYRKLALFLCCLCLVLGTVAATPTNNIGHEVQEQDINTHVGGTFTVTPPPTDSSLKMPYGPLYDCSYYVLYLGVKNVTPHGLPI